MPVELMITFNDGRQERFYIPLRMMRGSKTFDDSINTTELANWPWTNPTYTLSLPADLAEISKIELDPNKGMVDIDYSNNTWVSQNSTNE